MRTNHMTSPHQRPSTLISLAVLGAAALAPATAQQPADAPASREAEQQTIVVTASRRAQ